MSENLIVYYSRTGTARRVADILAAHTGWPLGQIRDARARAGFTGDVRCVLDMLLRRPPDCTYEGPAVADCRQLVVIAPVWLGHLAAPMRWFLQTHAPFGGTTLAAICVMAGSGGIEAEQDIASLAGRPPTPTLALLQRDVVNGSAADEIAQFATRLCRPQAGDPAVQRPAWLSPRGA